MFYLFSVIYCKSAYWYHPKAEYGGHNRPTEVAVCKWWCTSRYRLKNQSNKQYAFYLRLWGITLPALLFKANKMFLFCSRSLSRRDAVQENKGYMPFQNSGNASMCFQYPVSQTEANWSLGDSLNTIANPISIPLKFIPNSYWPDMSARHDTCRTDDARI